MASPLALSVLGIVPGAIVSMADVVVVIAIAIADIMHLPLLFSMLLPFKSALMIH